VPVEILSRTADYAVAVKPYGFLAEYAEGRDNMVSALADGLSLPLTSVYPVHRLDATTEGLMVYALSPRGAKLLSAAVADGSLGKRYTAFLTRDDALPSSGELCDMLYFDRRQQKAFVVTGNRSGAKEARLSYVLREPFDYRGTTVTPADVTLFTGRTHQIRAQFAARRSPLLGDGKYGSRVSYRKPSLFSVAISFPFDGKEVSFVRPAAFVG